MHIGLTFISSLPIQVAEFIMKNADVQHVNQGYSDPFTGTYMHFMYIICSIILFVIFYCLFSG